MADMETTLEDQTTDDASEPVEPPEPEQTDGAAPEPEPVADRTHSSALVKYDDRDREIIASVIGDGQLSYDEIDFVAAQAERLGLDIMTRHMHAWKDNRGKLIMMVSIDGLRLVAVRTGKFRGRTDPEWLHPEHGWVDAWVYDGYPQAARVRVQHADYPTPMTGIAVWAEAAKLKWNDRTKQHEPLATWKAMPAHMLAKVAEAMALRAAFPAELAGVYTDDEISRADALMSDVGDPVNEPGAGDDRIIGLEDRVKALPPEYRAKLEAWWADKYAPSIPGMGDVRPIHAGGLRRFTRDSEHIAYWSGMIDKAEMKWMADKAAGADESAGTDDSSSAEQPAAATSTDAPSEPADASESQSAAVPDSAPDPTTGLTDLEARIVDALEVLGSGRDVDVAQHMGMQAPSGQMRTVVAALFERDLIELDPDAEQGPGPLRVYRRNEQLLAEMAAHYSTDNETETDK